ncbi:Phenylalanyl-tRNA synthetase [Dendryphion nanum]|uniref:Phenylalanyl-tRNA synthetase n=1 Tax=Dendryphion nanum TaxID=256645 RepID=A0A9P9DUR3_9PLEO|nr:Phenylalanyl-tRNA synthetase [Dendryphion nanum]
MPPLKDPKAFLAAARIDPSVFSLRPDYRALLLIVQNIPPGPSDPTSETFLASAESSAKSALSTTTLTDIPHVAAWREAYKSFGVKPAKFRNSLEALMRRAENGLPRVNRLTDIYNAISIKHQIPLGGEDLDKYVSAPFLIRATGEETFDTMAAGEVVEEKPPVGEVVWCDEKGVTCRRWNWRQCARTGLRDETTSVLFIMDALEPCGDEALEKAAEELGSVLKGLSEGVVVEKRLLKKE